MMQGITAGAGKLTKLPWHGHTCPCPTPPTHQLRPAGQAAIDYSDDRVEALAQFQQACLLHALRFPALQRLAYSTCR